MAASREGPIGEVHARTHCGRSEMARSSFSRFWRRRRRMIGRVHGVDGGQRGLARKQHEHVLHAKDRSWLPEPLVDRTAEVEILWVVNGPAQARQVFGTDQRAKAEPI